MRRGRGELAPAHVAVALGLAVLAGLSLACPARACTCAGIRSSADPVHYTFAVDLAWKGVDTDTLTVLTTQDDAACGYRFRIGERYPVLGYLRNGRLWTGLCSGNDLLPNAMAARYLLPTPAPVVPGVDWPALDRDGLLEWMREGNVHARDMAATLLTGEYAARDPLDAEREQPRAPR